jgi:ABC-type Na+ efflux pump permease subunit
MRWPILRTLLHKELRRHLANRGGLVLIVLLIIAAMLLALTGGGGEVGAFASGVKRCYVDYWEDGPLIAHLKAHVPPELARQVRFRHIDDVPTSAGVIQYQQNSGAIQVRALGRGPTAAGLHVDFWHPGIEATDLAPFEAWFWKECLAFHQQQAAAALPSSERTAAGIAGERQSLRGGMDSRSGIATALVLFALFFVCVYLMPSLTCEERERGVLLAQALSPATAREILAAKFIFYPALGIVLAATLAATYRPAVLLSVFFWLGLLVIVAGSMGIGLTVASLARTQRAASMGAMSYMLAVAMILVICQQNGIPFLPLAALEYHSPRILHAALTDSVQAPHWRHLAYTAGLAVLWTVAAGMLFRRRGWQ